MESTNDSVAHATESMPTELCAIVLRNRETWFTFRCAVCSKPIAPLADGNIVWDHSEESTPLAPFEDNDKVALLDTQVSVVHKGCDPHDRLGECWQPLDAVLAINQNRFDQLRNDAEFQEFRKWEAAQERRVRASRMREFKKLCRLEPRLAELLKQAKAIRDDGTSESFCANARWYGRHGHPGLKPVLVELVGHGAKERGADPQLCTSHAYDLCSHLIYNALPPCRDCWCL